MLCSSLACLTEVNCDEGQVSDVHNSVRDNISIRIVVGTALDTAEAESHNSQVENVDFPVAINITWNAEDCRCGHDVIGGVRFAGEICRSHFHHIMSQCRPGRVPSKSYDRSSLIWNASL